MITVNGETINLASFPDGTLLVKIAIIDTCLDIKWKYESDAELFALICITKHLKQLNPEATFHLTMLYLPNARMDRVKVSEDVFTLKYFVDIINSLGFSKVRVLDPHSDASYSGLNQFTLNNIEVLSPQPYFYEALNRISKKQDPPTTVFFVDDGGKKRYSDMIDLPCIFGQKKRDWATGTILGTEIVGDPDLVKDKNILIIDDIVAYGGSIYHNALKLKELGCKDLFVFVTHMENSILDKKKGKLMKSGLIKKFYTTDSLLTKKHKLIEVINL